MTVGPMFFAPGEPAASGSGFRYWRAQYYELDGGGTSSSCGELGLRAVIGGPSVATGGTATASTTYPGYPASNAFDGLNNTLWSAQSGAGQTGWLAYQFPDPVSIVQVAYRGRHDGTFNQYWKAFNIQRSTDGVSWVTEWTVTGQTGWTTGEQRVFTKP